MIAMRIAQGSFNSATNPLSYSLVSDIVPPDRRATANSIISSGSYIGIAISSISLMLIKKFGWRFSYMSMGLSAIFLGLITSIFLKEPNRGAFLKIK